jgi:hypothetical protein
MTNLLQGLTKKDARINHDIGRSEARITLGAVTTSLARL